MVADVDSLTLEILDDDGVAIVALTESDFTLVGWFAKADLADLGSFAPADDAAAAAILEQNVINASADLGFIFVGDVTAQVVAAESVQVRLGKLINAGALVDADSMVWVAYAGFDGYWVDAEIRPFNTFLDAINVDPTADPVVLDVSSALVLEYLEVGETTNLNVVTSAVAARSVGNL